MIDRAQIKLSTGSRGPGSAAGNIYPQIQALVVYAEKFSVLTENDLTCITIECTDANRELIITEAVKRGMAHERFNGGVKIYE